MTYLAVPWFVLETTGSRVRTGLALGGEGPGWCAGRGAGGGDRAAGRAAGGRRHVPDFRGAGGFPGVGRDRAGATRRAVPARVAVRLRLPAPGPPDRGDRADGDGHQYA